MMPQPLLGGLSSKQDFDWKKINKIYASSKIKNDRSIQDGRQNLVYF
jgi:hypothetical protein